MSLACIIIGYPGNSLILSTYKVNTIASIQEGVLGVDIRNAYSIVIYLESCACIMCIALLCTARLICCNLLLHDAKHVYLHTFVYILGTPV